jgi:hypothetical protein
MGAICVLYVPGTRRSGGVVVKEIRFPFVAGGSAGTLRDQREALLHIFLLDTNVTATTTTTVTTTGRALLLLLRVLWLLLLLLLQVVGSRGVGGCIRDGVG